MFDIFFCYATEKNSKFKIGGLTQALGLPSISTSLLKKGKTILNTTCFIGRVRHNLCIFGLHELY